MLKKEGVVNMRSWKLRVCSLSALMLENFVIIIERENYNVCNICACILVNWVVCIEFG